MTYQLAYSAKLLSSTGVADISETEVAEITEQDVDVRDLESQDGGASPEPRHPDDETWALVEHIIEDAISAMEEAIQCVSQSSRTLILFSLKRSYRRIRAIRDRRGIYPEEETGDIQDFIDFKIMLQKYA